MIRGGALLAVAMSLGCGGRPSLTSCEQDLGGEYRVAGTTERWLVVDRDTTLEVFPMFADVPAVEGYEVAPRAIDLERLAAARASGDVAGHARRRYQRGRHACVAKVPVRITRCAEDTLDVLVADTTPPLAVEPCAFGRPEPSRRERWTRD